jgi:ABC-type transporter MlaC component
MKNITLFFLLLFISTNAIAGETILSFSKSAYESMVALDAKEAEFSKQAVEKFKKYFDFDGFNLRAMRDVKKKVTPKQYAILSEAFQEFFFLNFELKSQRLLRKKIAKPTYAVKEVKTDFTIVKISGETDEGPMNIDFYVHSITDDAYGMIDLAVDGVLLSRNYRSSFNRIYRDHGFKELLKRLEDQKKKLLTKKNLNK